RNPFHLFTTQIHAKLTLDFRPLISDFCPPPRMALRRRPTSGPVTDYRAILQVRGHAERLALGRSLYAAAADALDADTHALDRPLDFDLDAFQVGPERSPADARDFLADAAQVLRLASARLLVTERRFLAANRAVYAHLCSPTRDPDECQTI